jgi:hypothetical protein
MPQAIERLLATPSTKPRFPARMPELFADAGMLPGCVILIPVQKKASAPTARLDLMPRLSAEAP